MKNLIIYAHPGTKGHCNEILKQVRKKLDNFELIDLYNINYNPVLHKDELYTAGNNKVTKQNKQFQEQIIKADRLIFIYPLWWGTMPAILKGWFDRVFVNHFVFEYKNNIPKGLLNDKKAIAFISTGAPKKFSLLLSKGEFAKNLKNDILGFCGISTKVYQIDFSLELNKKQKVKIEKAIEKALGGKNESLK